MSGRVVKASKGVMIAKRKRDAAALMSESARWRMYTSEFLQGNTRSPFVDLFLAVGVTLGLAYRGRDLVAFLMNIPGEVINWRSVCPALRGHEARDAPATRRRATFGWQLTDAAALELWLRRFA
jgi:hypothetical protein